MGFFNSFPVLVMNDIKYIEIYYQLPSLAMLFEKRYVFGVT